MVQAIPDSDRPGDLVQKSPRRSSKRKSAAYDAQSTSSLVGNYGSDPIPEHDPSIYEWLNRRREAADAEVKSVYARAQGAVTKLRLLTQELNNLSDELRKMWSDYDDAVVVANEQSNDLISYELSLMGIKVHHELSQLGFGANISEYLCWDCRRLAIEEEEALERETGTR